MEDSKFWFIQYIQDLLLDWGASEGLTNVVTFISAALILAIIMWLLDVVLAKVVLAYINRLTGKTKTKWDDYLFKHKFFHKWIRLFSAILVLLLINTIFEGFSTELITATRTLTNCAIIILGANIVVSFLNAASDVYDSKPKRQQSIKGFIQTFKILIYIIAGVFVISTLLDKDPNSIIVGLGASAAVVTLVFKDTILGFVASIQLSSSDMVRLGDWISMPARNADGIVIDMTLTTVKVRNWDNTITMVPIYSMVSESFTNWRSMQEGTGRRFVRQILLDLYSLARLSDDEIERIKSDEYVAPYAGQMMNIAKASNAGPFITNVGLYRAYVEAYVRNHPRINNKLSLYVSYQPQGDDGIRLQISAFSAMMDIENYEKTAADIFDHIMAMAPVFGLRLFERPAGVVNKVS